MLALLLAAASVAEPRDLFDADAQAGRISSSDGQASPIARVAVEAAPWVEVIDARSSTTYEQPWTLQSVHRPAEPAPGAVKVGDTILVSFWARVLEADSDVGRVDVSLTTDEPGDSLLFEKFRVRGGEWTQYHLSKRAAVAADQPRLALHYGQAAQHLQIGPVTLRNYGPDVDLRELPTNNGTYQGREPDAAWRAAAAERIQKLRTRPMTLTVNDAAGDPVAGAEVELRLRKHAFRFGSAVRLFLVGLDRGEFPTKQWTNHTWSAGDADHYRDIVGRLFTLVTPEAAFRPNMLDNMRDPEGSYNADEFRRARRAVEGSVPFLREHGVTMRGHYLSWGAIDHPPQDKYAGDRDAHYAYQKAILQENPPYVDDLSEGLVVEWDAINHPCGWGETMEQLYGGLDMHVEIMKDARQHCPEGVKLVVNEGNVLAERSQIPWFKRILAHLNENDARPDAVGFMAHFNESSLTGMDEAWSILDDFGRLADKLEITELDVSTGGDERLQADYLRDITTLAFSHPQMDAVVMWGFWENAHWKPETALWRADWSIKPAGEEYVKLLTETWHTAAEATTAADGRVSVDGAFLGSYDVVVRRGDELTRHSVKHDGSAATVTLK